MTAIWTYSAIIQDQSGDIHEVTFNSKEELTSMKMLTIKKMVEFIERLKWLI